jgi:hypothetical protein
MNDKTYVLALDVGTFLPWSGSAWQTLQNWTRVFKPRGDLAATYRGIEGRQEILYRALISDRILGT